ncbi:peptidylprolyl isomerase [Paenibacillus oenotherae]|uniref:Foldase protein PrsA n=1 Tax=Paenibacillus oenotherae TaxID=1435645 RepID=A0ABS7D0A2_9BACL|nr:peptidylprolyl isomerase [Paenibacillus oenotherae]MBW7473350.1 peptidylprolyl isomerase [Paenibacillus oenotherae]
MNEKDSEQKNLDLSKKDTDRGIDPDVAEDNAIVSESGNDAPDTHAEEQTQERAGGTPAAGSSGKAWMFIAIGLALLLVIVLWKPPFGGGDSNEVVATVNGDDITKADLYKSLVEVGGEQTLDNLIQETLINQEADKAGVKITEADINKEIDSIKERFGGSEEELTKQLQSSGMTIETLKKQLAPQLTMRKILEPKVTITDDEIKQFFDENKAQFDTVEQVKVAHILLATKEEAEAVLKQLKEGADFAQLAKEKSTDPGSKDNGGEYDFFPRGTMHEPFEDAAFNLKKDELSGVVQTDSGFHVIKLLDRKDAHSATLEEKKEEVKDIIMNNKTYEMSQTWLKDLNDKAKITNNLKDEKKDAEGAADKEANTGADKEAK